jgi:hypothetical protein
MDPILWIYGNMVMAGKTDRMQSLQLQQACFEGTFPRCKVENKPLSAVGQYFFHRNVSSVIPGTGDKQMLPK